MDFSGWTRADAFSAISLCVAFAALIVSAVAAAGALWQARIAHHAHQRNLDNEQPIVTWRPLTPFTAWPGWYSLFIVITNRADREMTVESAHFANARFKIIPHGLTASYSGGYKLLPPPADASRRAEVNMLVAPADHIKQSERDYEPRCGISFVLTWEPSGNVFSKLAAAWRKSQDTAFIFLTVSFREETTKKKVIPITIELPKKSAAIADTTSI